MEFDNRFQGKLSEHRKLLGFITQLRSLGECSLCNDPVPGTLVIPVQGARLVLLQAHEGDTACDLELDCVGAYEWLSSHQFRTALPQAHKRVLAAPSPAARDAWLAAARAALAQRRSGHAGAAGTRLSTAARSGGRAWLEPWR